MSIVLALAIISIIVIASYILQLMFIFHNDFSSSIRQGGLLFIFAAVCCIFVIFYRIYISRRSK